MLSTWPGLSDTTVYWSTLLGGIPGFFEPNPLAFLGAHYPLGRDKAGFYSTAPLEKTLTELVDFALIKRCTPRLTVGAAHVRTSEMRYFDSRETAITVRACDGIWRAAAGVSRPFASMASSIGTAAFFRIRRPRRSLTTIRAETP